MDQKLMTIYCCLSLHVPVIPAGRVHCVRSGSVLVASGSGGASSCPAPTGPGCPCGRSPRVPSPSQQRGKSDRPARAVCMHRSCTNVRETRRPPGISLRLAAALCSMYFSADRIWERTVQRAPIAIISTMKLRQTQQVGELTRR